MSNKSEQRALLKRCKEIIPIAPSLTRLTRFINMGFVDNSIMEEIETAIVLNIIQSKEPILGICSIHPLQKKFFVGAAWIEDGCIRVVFTMQKPDQRSSDVATFDREFSGDTIGKVLSRLAFTGGTFISQYQHAFHDVMSSIQSKAPIEEKGVKVQVINDLAPEPPFEPGTKLILAPSLVDLWKFFAPRDKKD